MLAYKFRCSTNANTNTNTSELSVELKRLIVDVLDTKCKSLIAWARRVPRFGSLQIEDRTVSIEMNFLDIILLDSMWMSLVSSTTSSQFALTFHNQYLQIDRATCKQLQLDDLYDRLFSLVARLADMQLTRDEFLCLKALSLFKSEFGFTNKPLLDQFRHQCYRALRQASSNASKSKQQQPQMASYRYDSLLLLLVDIKLASVKLMTVLSQFAAETTTANNNETANLLFDMITSNMDLVGISRPSSLSSSSSSNILQSQSSEQMRTVVDEIIQEEDEPEEEEDDDEEDEDEDEEVESAHCDLMEDENQPIGDSKSIGDFKTETMILS